MAEFLPFNGIINAKDKDTSNKVPLTAVQDPDGEWVLRIVDAAPFAYENATDTLKVKVQNTVDVNRTDSILTKRVYRVGELAASTDETIIDIESEVIIHEMIFNTAIDSFNLRVEIYMGGFALMTIGEGGVSDQASTALCPARANRFPFFELASDEEGKYSMKFKDEFSGLRVKGLKVILRNRGVDNPQNIGAFILYSEVV